MWFIYQYISIYISILHIRIYSSSVHTPDEDDDSLAAPLRKQDKDAGKYSFSQYSGQPRLYGGVTNEPISDYEQMSHRESPQRYFTSPYEHNPATSTSFNAAAPPSSQYEGQYLPPQHSSAVHPVQAGYLASQPPPPPPPPHYSTAHDNGPPPTNYHQPPPPHNMFWQGVS